MSSRITRATSQKLKRPTFVLQSRTLRGALAASVLAVTLAPASGAAADETIVKTAAAAGTFKTLVAAVEAAGLTETLTGDGPFTVFAPTDEAFAKLPDGTIDALIADPPRLRAILKYHVLAGRVMAADAAKLILAKTSLGQSITIDASKGVRVDGANVVTPDLICSNGVIHVIDAVLMPKADLIDTARSAGSFSTLLAAISAAGLTDTMRGEGPFTVFAPTDDAFAKLPRATLDDLLRPENKAKLAKILTYHVVLGEVNSSDVAKMKKAKTVQGAELRIQTKDGNVMVDRAQVVKADVAAGNGVIHVIDTVVLPADL
jgi:uncharacterized surface protein with fasciclin (FAS1) repeats